MDMFNVSAASIMVDNLEKSSIPPLISVYHLMILTQFHKLDILFNFKGHWQNMSAEGCHVILKVQDAPQCVFCMLSQVYILWFHQYQIIIINALVGFAPDYGITWCMKEYWRSNQFDNCLLALTKRGPLRRSCTCSETLCIMNAFISLFSSSAKVDGLNAYLFKLYLTHFRWCL